MRSKMERRDSAQRIGILEPFSKSFYSMWRPKGSHAFGQISVYFRILKVNRVTFVVLKDPRKDWILSQIMITSTRSLIQKHEVLEIRYLPVHPSLSNPATLYISMQIRFCYGQHVEDGKATKLADSG